MPNQNIQDNVKYETKKISLKHEYNIYETLQVNAMSYLN